MVAWVRMKLFPSSGLVSIVSSLVLGCGGAEEPRSNARVSSSPVHVSQLGVGAEACASASALTALRHVAPEPWSRVSLRDFDGGRRRARDVSVDEGLVHLYTLDVYAKLGFRGRIVNNDLDAFAAALERGRPVLVVLERPGGLEHCSAVLDYDPTSQNWLISDPLSTTLEYWPTGRLESELSSDLLSHFEVWWEDPRVDAVLEAIP